MNELRRHGELDVWVDSEYADNQQRDRPQLHVGRKVIARLQQKPDQVEVQVAEHRERASRRRFGKPTPAEDAGNQQDDPHRARDGNPDLSGRGLEHEQSHQDGNGYCHRNGEHAPRTIGHRIYDYDAQSGERH